MLREALELQVLEQDPEQAAGTVGQGRGRARRVTGGGGAARGHRARRSGAWCRSPTRRSTCPSCSPGSRSTAPCPSTGSSCSPTSSPRRRPPPAASARRSTRCTPASASRTSCSVPGSACSPASASTSLAIEATEAEVVEDLLLAFELDDVAPRSGGGVQRGEAGGGGEAVVGLPGRAELGAEVGEALGERLRRGAERVGGLADAVLRVDRHHGEAALRRRRRRSRRGRARPRRGAAARATRAPCRASARRAGSR